MKKIVISNSMLRTLVTCHTKARLASDGWGSSAEPNKRMLAGSAAALAFQAWRQGKSPDQCLDAFDKAYKEFSDAYLLEGDAYHRGNLLRILEVFFSANPLAAMDFSVTEAEQQLEMELFHTGSCIYSVSDKSDAVVRDMDTGQLLSVDDKTTGWIGQDYLNNYALDSQFTGHVAACRANGRDVKGVLLQVLQFNKLPDPLAVTPKTGKPVSCRAAGHGLVKNCWQRHVRWERFVVTRSQEDIDVWRRNTVELIKTYEDVLQASIEALPQQGIYGHCGSCDYLAFCQSYRRNFDNLVKRPREAGVLYSGAYEVDNG